MTVILGMVAVVIDGSYGLIENRRAQSATDFAAFAASQQLLQSDYCIGASTPSTADIVSVIQQLVDDNDGAASTSSGDIGSGWTADFVNSQGNAIADSSFSPGSDSGDPPPGACGVKITAKPSWNTFFAGIFGDNKLTGYASSAVSNTVTGTPYGIIGLNKVGPHVVLGGGTGDFDVSGNIFLNTDVKYQPWSGWTSTVADQTCGSPATGCYLFDDAIDAKGGSSLTVDGTISTIGTYDEASGPGVATWDNGASLWPLDTCFESSGPVSGADSLDCTSNGAKLSYQGIDADATAIDDPLRPGPGTPPDPLSSSSIACPGLSSVPTYSSVTQVAGGTTELSPGEYTQPVTLTGSANFQDCSGGYPGIYRFDKGLYIDPQSASDTVSGSNVLIATNQPLALAGNVPGSLVAGTFVASTNGSGQEVGGNGGPCLPAGTTASALSGSNPETDSSASCGGSTDYGVVARHDSWDYGGSSCGCFPIDTSNSGTGSNFSLIIGGVSGATVDLSGPTTGAYAGTDGSAGLLFYQEPSTQANFGFDADSGDAATINLTGVVYNASLEDYGADAPQDFWDGTGGGIPFYAAGTLQTGYGAGWIDGPAQSAGSVTLTGTAIVDNFNTDGTTTIDIVGEPYTLPGGSKLSLIG